MWQSVRETGGILNLWTKPSRQTERAFPVDPHRPTHEGISLARGGRPFKSDKISAVSTCPHRELHPKDKDMGKRGRRNFLCQIVWILASCHCWTLPAFISFLPTLCEKWLRVRERWTHIKEAKCFRDWRPTYPSRTRVRKHRFTNAAK